MTNLSEREYRDNLPFEDEYYQDYLRTLARRQRRERTSPRRVLLAIVVIVVWVVVLLAVSQIAGF